VEHRIQVQVAPPTENDPGAIVEGSYTLTEDGVVRVYDHNLLGTEHLAGAVAAATARRVLREKKSPNAFCGRSRQLFIVLGNPKHHAFASGSVSSSATVRASSARSRRCFGSLMGTFATVAPYGRVSFCWSVR
jgi:hypothetical protein